MGVLRDRMIEEMKLRNFSAATQESYVYAVSRLARYHNKSPDQLSKEDIRAFLVHLTIERKLLFDFTLGTQPISRKGTSDSGGAKRRSALSICLY